MQKVFIIIPCYNEERRLPIHAFRQFLATRKAELIFVNDGSTDQTLQILDLLKMEFSQQVHILNLPKNVGKGEAVRQGIFALEKLNTRDIIGFMDADLSTPLAEVDNFLIEFNDTRLQFVFGSRISRIGARIERFNHRHYFGRLIATLVSLYLHLPIYDSQCGAKFFHAGLATKLFFNPFVSRWLFDVEIFKRIELLNIKVSECSLELPLHTWIEKGGSKIRLRDYLNLPFEFYRIAHYYSHLRSNSPFSLSPIKTLISLEPKTRTMYEA